MPSPHTYRRRRCRGMLAEVPARPLTSACCGVDCVPLPSRYTKISPRHHPFSSAHRLEQLHVYHTVRRWITAEQVRRQPLRYLCGVVRRSSTSNCQNGCLVMDVILVGAHRSDSARQQQVVQIATIALTSAFLPAVCPPSLVLLVGAGVAEEESPTAAERAQYSNSRIATVRIALPWNRSTRQVCNFCSTGELCELLRSGYCLLLLFSLCLCPALRLPPRHRSRRRRPP